MCRNRSHSADEETQYVELALGLIDAVDEPTRATVAARLSAYPAAPVAILAMLGGASPQTGSQAPAKSETKTAPKPKSRNDLIELFFAANSEERRLILTNLDAAAEMPAHRPVPASSEVIRRLENAALQRNPGEFSRMLEHALGIGRELAERIARDPSGEPIVVAARALGMSAAVLQRILLFLNPAIGQSVERVYDLARLYDDLTPAAAERMLAIWRQPDVKSNTKPQAAHAPLYWDDERRDARSLVDAGALPLRPPPRRAADARQDQRPALSHHIAVEKIPPGAVLDLDDPDIGIEADFTRQPRFDIGLRRRPVAAQHGGENAVGRLRLVEGGLRRRPVQCGGAVEPADLDEDRAGLFGATPAHRREGAFDIAAAQIGRHPDAGFQPHDCK